MVQSSSDGAFWTLPGGGVRASESVRRAARRELWEEAGAKGRFLAKNLPIYAQRRRNKVLLCYVYFLFEVTQLAEAWPEHKQRKRKWVAADKLGRAKWQGKLTAKSVMLVAALAGHPKFRTLISGGGKNPAKW